MFNDKETIKEMLNDLENWMVSKKYKSVTEFIGKLSQKNVKNPMMHERAQFMKYYSNHY